MLREAVSLQLKDVYGLSVRRREDLAEAPTYQIAAFSRTTAFSFIF